MRDIREWVKNNPKYNDYYNEDMKAVRVGLEAEYGPISDTELLLYQFLNGITSPGTALIANVGDAVKLFDIYKRDGNFDSFEVGKRRKVNKEGKVIYPIVVTQAPFDLSGATQPTKARSLKSLDKLIQEQGGVQAALDYLRQPVTLEELKAFKLGLGYKGVYEVGIIKGLVEDATVQSEMIPRMFFLGPKIGAYTLNLMGNPKYQTVDVWESRFIRSYYDNMFDTNTGITVTADEGKLFRDFSKVFAEEFEKEAGYRPDPASLQAMRWFYMINAAREAGYSGASTNETISELTEKQIQNTRRTRYEGRTAGDREVLGRAEEEQVLESRRQIDPAKIEKAVQQNQQEARNAGFSVPLYSVKASPEAQYIARNPEAAVEPEEVLESRAPEYNTKTKSFINRLIEGTPERVDPMKQYMDVTGDNSTLDYKLTQAKQALVNRYARLEKLNQRYFKDYLADSSSIAAVLFADRSAGVMAEAIKSGVPQYKDGLTKVVDFTHNGKQYRGLIDIINLLRTKKYGDITEFAQAYAIAMRGERLNKEGKATPVSQQDIDEARENIKQFTDENGYNPVVEWYGAWQAYNNQVITFLEDTGVIDEKGANSWRLASDYIPFYRALEPNYETGKITNHPFGDLKQVGAFKPYKGKTDKINVPLVESILKNTAAAIDLGMRNVAQQRIARDMQKLQLAKQVKYGTKGNDIITLKVQGKPVSFRLFDPLILESMSAIDGSGVEEISRIFFGPASTLLRETVTRTPGFMLANMLRDSFSAFVTSGSSFIPLLGTTKGFFSNINNLERTGVVGGYDFKVDQQDIGKIFAQEADRRKRNGLPLNMFKTIWDASGRLTTRSDAATRQAVYDEVYARTGNEAEAHFQAMEVLNFSRRGSNGLARAITAAIPFLNARIQGLDVLWRSFLGVNNAKRGVPRGTAALSFAMRGAIISFATALYWMMVSDDEEYKEASREEKDNNWLFPLKGVEGVGAVKIPIPFEVGLIFKTIPEVVLDTTYGDRTSRQAFQSFKQGVGSTLELNLLYGIQAYAPLLEAHSNYSSYTGRPIVPIWLTGQRPEYQRTDSTSETAIFLQKATPYLASIPLLAMDEGGTSPMKIEHVIKGYTVWAGLFLLDRQGFEKRFR